MRGVSRTVGIRLHNNGSSVTRVARVTALARNGPALYFFISASVLHRRVYHLLSSTYA